MPSAAISHPARFAPSARSTTARTDGALDRATRPARGCWSTRIVRTAAGVEVTIRGRVDQPAAALLDQLLMDLVVGQGNRVVTVDAQELVAPEESDLRFRGVASAARARGARFTVCRGSTSGEGASP